MASDTRISVVVPARDSGRYIRALLSSLASQTRPPDEVVVVDAGSVDDTPAVVSAFSAGFPELRILRAGTAFPGRARNIGIREASGDLIVMTDSDTVPDPDWLRNISAPFDSDPGLGAVFGAYFVHPETYLQRCILAVIMSGGKVLGEGKVVHTDSFVSAALRKSAFGKAGWFQEGVRAGEDMEMRARLDSAGIKVSYACEARVRWRPPVTLWGMMRRTASYVRERTLASNFNAGALKLPVLYCVLGAAVLSSPVIGLLLALSAFAVRMGRAGGRLSGEERRFLLSPFSIAALMPVYLLNDMAAMAGSISAVLGRSRDGGVKDKYSSLFEVERSRVIEREFLRPFLRPGAEVLDIGAGTGHYSALIRSMGGRVSCVDYDQAKVDVLKDSGFDASRADVQRGLPFADGTFDFVTALEVIEHLERPERLLAEASRVLKDDGLLLISTPNRVSLEALFGYISGLFTGRKWRAWDDSHRRIYSPSEIKAEVGAFFDILKITGFYLIHKGRFVPSGLCFTSFNGGILAERSFIINILARPKRLANGAEK